MPFLFLISFSTFGFKQQECGSKPSVCGHAQPFFFPVLRNSKTIGRSHLETRCAGIQLLHFYAVRLVRMCLCYIPQNGVLKTREKSTFATRYKVTEPCLQILFVQERCSLPCYVKPWRCSSTNKASKKNMVVAVAFKFRLRLRIMKACTFYPRINRNSLVCLFGGSATLVAMRIALQYQ